MRKGCFPALLRGSKDVLIFSDLFRVTQREFNQRDLRENF